MARNNGPRFAFYEKVTVAHATGERKALVGEIGAVMGRAQGETGV